MPLRASLVHLSERLKATRTGYMVLLSVVIGLLGGYGAVGFRWLIRYFQETAWVTTLFTVEHVRSMAWYWIVGIPTAGGLIVGSITKWFAPEAKGHGVPEVMEAVVLRGGNIRPRVVAAKAVASGVCIASGGSVGREGPIVQIGAAVGSTVGQMLHVSARRMRTLVGCGAAAGIAATFNAPVAGALFAVEVVLGDFGVPQFSPIVISSVIATVVSRHHLADVPAFQIPSAQLSTYQLVHPLELLAYVALGLLAGLVAYFFIKALYFSEDCFEKSKLSLPVAAGIGGALVGCIALLYPEVLGVGYESMGRVLLNSPGFAFLGGLLLAKLAAVCVTLGSGGSGGIFAPSLFVGSMLGGFVGLIAHGLFPDFTAPASAYALVGMGAVVAATTHAPLTAILILFELTGDYRIMLPLMTSCIIATLLAMRLSKESIYTIKLVRRGINVRAGQDINVLRNIAVREVLREEVPTIAPSERLRPLIERMSHSESANLYLVDENANLKAILTMREVRPLLGNIDALQDVAVALDVASTRYTRIRIDDSLDTVLSALDLGYRDELPVLDGTRLAGVVRIEDVLARYRQEVKKREVAAGITE